MTFPSTGCQTCKDRRIKCDESKPACQRCIKSKRVCYGMQAEQAYSVVHIENSYASGQKKRPRGPRSTRQIELNGNSGVLLQSPSVDLKSKAVSYYIHCHLQTLENTPSFSKGLSDDFVSVWVSTPLSPILDLAVTCTALAVFSRTQKYPQAAREASVRYHQLLRVTQKTLSSLDEGNLDICLLAIFFMGRYENTVHLPTPNRRIPFTDSLRALSHHTGGLALLKVWKDDLRHKYPATDVIKHTRRTMIKYAFLRHLAFPEWLEDGSYFGESGVDLEYDHIIVRILKARQQLSKLLEEKTSLWSTSHELISTAESFNKEAQSIDQALQDWVSHFSTLPWYQLQTLPNPHPSPTQDFYSSTIYSYTNPTYAAVWNKYYASRMLINSTRLRFLELSHPTLDEPTNAQRLECLANISSMSDEIATSIPFCVDRLKVTKQNSIVLTKDDDVRPYVTDLAIWALTVATSLEYGDVEQKAWFRAHLVRLGRLAGASVVECAEAEQWVKL